MLVSANICLRLKRNLQYHTHSIRQAHSKQPPLLYAVTAVIKILLYFYNIFAMVSGTKVRIISL